MSDIATDPDTSTEPHDGHTVVIPEPADAEPTTPEPAAASDEDKARRNKGLLEADVKRICDAFVVGQVTLKEDELLTPHKISRLIQEIDGLTSPPSTGAVAANLARWKDIGFAQLNEKPVAFLDYTDAGRSEGLSALKAAHAAHKRAARKAEKDAAKPAESTPEPDSTDTPIEPA